MDDKQVMHAMSIDDMYRVERVLASGQGGVTELVTVDGTGPFVRKKISLQIVNQGVWAAVATLGCRRLPQVEATYTLPDAFVVVYDYMPGETLEELVTASGGLDAARAVELVDNVCEAASALHSCGVIHRDISPRNVIVAADGAHLIDLGIARMRVESATRDTTFLGTRGYASPEQYGFAQTDARSDVYSIGRLLGYMLTGVEPDDERYEGLLADPARVEPRLAEVVRRACSFEPSARYQSAAELAAAAAGRQADVAASVGEAPIDLGAKAQEASAGRGISRRALLVGAGAVAAVGAGALLASALRGGADDGDAAASATDGAASGDAGSAASGTAAGGGATLAVDGGEPLELVESGWSLDSSGYVHYAFGVRNPNDDVLVELPQISVTGYDAAGGVVFSEQAGLMVVLPGQACYFGAPANTSGTKPDRVEFALEEGVATSARQFSEKIEITTAGLKAIDDAGAVRFTGTVTIDATDEAIEAASGYASSISVTIILRNAAGEILYGENNYIYSLAAGAHAFDVSILDAPAYATAEAYAQLW